jgi:iron complex transport system ATP-binding protein
VPDVPGVSGGPAVDAEGLVLLHGDKVALADSDFRLPGGAVTALIGPNGSGKSSVISAIAGLHPPAAGSITVLGRPPGELRARVALVPQSTKVNDSLPVTVREVVAMGRYASLRMLGRFHEEDRRSVDDALARLDLEGLSGRHLRELSGGQRQRVFVAQGLVQEKDLLLLDEPTTGLDLVSSQVIHEVVATERSQGRPVVLTTHDFPEARQADHVVLLANRVVAEGPPDAVFTTENLAAAYGLAEVAGHVHMDDAAHRPVDPRHVHVEPRQIRGSD